MDWDDLKIAFAIARHGSLNAAARALGTTQPTVSRRLNGLERSIGVKLFEHGASGLSPTPLCAALLESLGQMDEGAQAVERRIAARDTGLEGPITVTSLGWFGDDILAPLLARFSAEHRQVSIDLINDPRRFNLPIPSFAPTASMVRGPVPGNRCGRHGRGKVHGSHRSGRCGINRACGARNPVGAPTNG